MDMWTIGWLAWIGFFALWEGLALRRGWDATLSGHLCRWFGIDGDPNPDGVKRTRRFALVAGLAWLAAHLLTGGFF